MVRYYQLPAEVETPFAGKDRFMKDKQKRYVQLDQEAAGTMGYWDKKCVPMYAMKLQVEQDRITCQLRRQEERKGKQKHPHDIRFSLLMGLLVFAVLFLVLDVLVRLPLYLTLTISTVAGVIVGVSMLLIYLFEYRGFYRLLDDYMMRTVKAKPVKRKK